MVLFSFAAGEEIQVERSSVLVQLAAILLKVDSG